GLSTKWRRPLRQDRKGKGMNQRLVEGGSLESSGNQSCRAGTSQPSYRARANAEPRHQGRLIFVFHELLFALSPCRTAAAGKRSCGRASGLSHSTQQAKSLTAGASVEDAQTCSGRA